jgi:single-stranded-DNA-specific exonuclease
MERARDSFIEFGGHHASGGFAVKEEKIHSLAMTLEEAFDPTDDDLRIHDEKIVDADLTLSDVHDALYCALERLSPFGVGNHKPLFRFIGVTPDRVTSFGKKGEHTKLSLKNQRGTLEAISFFKTPESFTPKLGKEPVDLIAHIERSHFMGRPQLRLRIVDVV